MTVIPNMQGLAAKLSGEQRRALLTDEAAMGRLPSRQRADLEALGVVRSASPNFTGTADRRTWITPLGCALRDWLTRSEEVRG